MSAEENLNPQQFYHGTAHEFSPGELIDPTQPHARTNMGRGNMVYVSERKDSAQGYANSAARERNWNGVRGTGLSYEGPHKPHVYAVEPTGEIHPDPAASSAWMSRAPVRVLHEESS